METKDRQYWVSNSWEGRDREWLKRHFEGEEVLLVVKNMNGDKALGLDGFTIVYDTHFWGES